MLCTPGELIGQSALEMYRESPDILFHIKRALAGEHEHFTIPFGNMMLETWYVPVTSADGVIDATIGVALDITKRVRLEEQFRQAINDMNHRLRYALGEERPPPPHSTARRPR